MLFYANSLIVIEFCHDSIKKMYFLAQSEKTPAREFSKTGVHNERRKKWYLQESNRGHTDFQSDALPTELRHHHVFKAILLIAGAKVRIINEK